MTPEKYKVIKEILVQVLQTPKENQEQLLDDLCGSNKEIKHSVEKLLKLDGSKHSSKMEVPAVISQIPDIETNQEEEEIPTQIKDYKILKKIGSGGMGNVYLAMQSFPAERKVAIKVLKQLPNQQRLFEETQILAQLNHPNIATLHEVDKTDDGQLFIVMELIEGEDIIKWCEQHDYDLKQKIALFQQLCTGISYAHEKGIIHCDIKPSNVQVTNINNNPVVKIIDFGISQYKKNQNNQKEIAGTPAYLAPEVLNSKDNGISDTRRDVYALGVLLRKLLQIETTKDLTAIIEKATHHEKSLRYATATSLNNDLQRFLDKRIVKARARTIPYVVSRYVQRNLGFVLFTFVLMLSLAGGFIAQSIQANKAKLQAKIAIENSKAAEVARSEAVELTSFLVDLFDLSNPERASQKEITTNDLIDKANNKLLAIDAPTLSDARFMHTIGSIYTRMDQLDKAQNIIEKSLSIKQSKLNENDDEIISGVTQLGLIHRRLKNNNLAEEYLNKAINLHESKADPNLSQLAYTHNHLGNFYWQNNQINKSVNHHINALKLREQTGETKLLADSYNNLGAIYIRNKQWNLAKFNLSKALIIYREFYNENHPYITFALNNLANVEEHLFNWKVAENLFRITYAKLTDLYGESHQNTIIAQINLAIFYSRRMRFDESTELRMKAIEIYKEKGNIDQMVKQMNRIASDFHHLGEFAKAKQIHTKALLTIKGKTTKDKFLKEKLEIDYAGLLIEQGHFELAKNNLDQSIEALRSLPDNTYFYYLTAINLLANIYLKGEKHKEAYELFNQVIQLSNDKSKANQREVIKAHIGIGNIQTQLKNYAQAEKNLQLAIKIAQFNYGKKHELIAKTLIELGHLALIQKNIKKAKEFFDKSLAMQMILLPEIHPDLIKTKNLLFRL